MPMEDRIYSAYGTTGAAARAGTAYTGEVMEASTGWYVLGSRVYAPTLRRFLCDDPASPFGPGGINRYAYCGGDPISRVDPSGNAWWSWLRSGIGRQRGTPTAQNSSEDLVSSMLTPTTATAGAPTPAIAFDHAPPTPAPRRHGPLDSIVTRPAAGTAERGETPDIARYRNIGNYRPLGQLMSRRSPSSQPAITVTTNPGRRNVMVLTAGKFIEPEWHEKVLYAGRRPLASHWLADAEIISPHIQAALDRITQKHKGSQPNVYIYVGVHGLTTGDNWKKGVRQFPTEWDYKNFGPASLRALYPTLNIELENIAAITESEMKKRIRHPGEHVHGYCYSGTDRFLTSALNIREFEIFKLP